MSQRLPRIALTLGDVAGIGPEVIVRAWADSPLRSMSRPFVVGHCGILEAAARRFSPSVRVHAIEQPELAEPSDSVIPCLEATDQPLEEVIPGEVDSRAGRAAYDFLVRA